MKYKANEINEILENLIALYSDLKCFNKEDLSELKQKVKKIKSFIQNKEYDEKFIKKTLLDEKEKFITIMENEPSTDYDKEIIEENIFLIEELFEYLDGKIME